MTAARMREILGRAGIGKGGEMAGSETRVTDASTRHPDHDLTVGRGRVWPALSRTGAPARPGGDRVRATGAGLDPLQLLGPGFPRSFIPVALGGPVIAAASAAPGAASLTGARGAETKAARC
jgi:hypothetical protein